MNNIIPPENYILIIGAMKAGTSSLFHFLGQHPEICLSNPKEPQFFAEHHAQARKVQAYEDLWDFDPKKHRYALEASTSYSKYPHEQKVASRIYAAGIRPKIIYLVRDPLQRIESQFRHLRENRSPINPWPAPLDYAISLSSYYMQLKDYVELFGRDSIEIINFDQLIKNPEKVVTLTLSRLGLGTDVPLSFQPQNQSEQARTNKRHPLKRPALALSNAFHDHLFNPARRLPRKLSKKDEVYARERLSSDMQNFAQTFEFDVTEWGF